MTREPPMVIEDREELIFMLSEAAALEHMLMCEYLFATFSLKREVSVGLTAAQLAAIKGWERVVALVATQEMLHLALASNLLTCIDYLGHPFRKEAPWAFTTHLFRGHAELCVKASFFKEGCLR
jgi:hypothetical protein